MNKPGKIKQRAANLLDRIRASVEFWESDKGEKPMVVRMSAESLFLVLPAPVQKVIMRSGGARFATLEVEGVPIEIDNTLAEGSYRVN